MHEVTPEIALVAGNLRVDVVAAEVVKRFDDVGIPCILLKGPAFARLLYESRHERGYVDVDLLVAPEDYERAGRELAALGFTCSNPAPRIPLDRPIEGREWSREDGAVDLHQSIPEVVMEPEESWRHLWPRTEREELRGVSVTVLDVPRRALLVGLHAAHHGHSSPKGIEDLRRAIRVLSPDVWTEAVRSARYLQCEDAFATGLRLIPEGQRLASELALSNGVWAEGALQLEDGGAESLGVALAMERMSKLSGVRARMVFLARKLFPPRLYMREWLNAHPGRGGLPSAYVRRLGAYLGHFLQGARRWRKARSHPRREGEEMVQSDPSAPAIESPPAPAGEPAPRRAFDVVRRARKSMFARAVAGTAGANLAATALGSAGGILLARALGPTLRGELALVVAWPTFVSFIALLGLPQATCYLVSRSKQEARSILGTVTVGSLVVSVVIGVAGILVSPFVANSAELVRYLRLLFALLPLFTVPICWIATLQAVRIQHWNVARVVQPAAYFAGILGLALAGRLTVGTAVAALVASLLLQVVVGGVLVWREVGPPARPERDLWRPMLSYGLKSTASLGPQIVNYRLDQLVLSLMVPAAALGNYTVAVSMSVLATPIAFAFGYVAFPRIAAAKTRAEARRLERASILGSLVVATAVLIPLGLAAHWLLPFVFGKDFDTAVIALWLLIPGTIVFSANQVAEDILRGRGKPLMPALAEGAGAVGTMGLLVILVPAFGIYGAAVTSAIVYVGVGLLLTKMLRQTPELSGSPEPHETPASPSATLLEVNEP